ncbi:MAG: Uma2 family endonuclease [Isosphaeraceae bacterium]|nr:Uma2 family endonuclease [Isosphaeraceae bacterium]
MATTAKTTDKGAGEAGIVPYRLTVSQFLKMIDAGVFPEDAHVELLGGLLVDRFAKRHPHNFAVDWLGDRLRRALPESYHVREEKSYVHGRYDRPEPDLAVVRGALGDYRHREPRPQDIALLIEVADVSYAKDRGAKWWRYASAGIPVYVIANLKKAQVEVCSNPSGRGESAVYRTVDVYEVEAEFPIVVDGREVGCIAVRDLLP